MAKKIGIISDTHGLLRPEVLEILKTCDCILHAGDAEHAVSSVIQYQGADKHCSEEGHPDPGFPQKQIRIRTYKRRCVSTASCFVFRNEGS